MPPTTERSRRAVRRFTSAPLAFESKITSDTARRRGALVATREVVHDLGEAELGRDPADAPVGAVAVVVAEEAPRAVVRSA